MASFATPFPFPLGGPTGVHPTVYMRTPDDGATGVAADTQIWIDFLDGSSLEESVWVDTITITVDGVLVFSEEAGSAGWVANVSTIAGGNRVKLISPSGFLFGAEVSVVVGYSYGDHSVDITGIAAPVFPADEGKQYTVLDDAPEAEAWRPPSNYRGEYSLATRPAANTLAAGEYIYNTDAKAYNVSDGTDWYTLNGVLT